MATYSYKAADSTGKTIKGLIEADSERLAILSLNNKGLIPLSIKTTTQHNSSSSPKTLRAFFTFQRSVPQSTIAAIIRQLATLFRAGLPLVEALSSLCKHDDHSQMKEPLAQIRDKIIMGSTFSDSLAEFPKIFSPTFTSMVRAGEESGTLELVIERYANHIESRVALIRKIQSTLAYPIFMLIVGTAIVIFLLTFVIPQVTSIFIDMGKPLPNATQILLNLSNGLRNWWWLILIVVMAGIFGGIYAKQTPKGHLLWHKFLLKCPIVSKLYRDIIVGQMTRTLGMLINNGVSLLKSLHIVLSITDNKLMHNAIQAMIDGVQEGQDLSSFMGDKLIFPPLTQQMVAAGEKSGHLGNMILWVAENCDNNVATRLQILTSLLEPVMILILGGIVGFVVIAIMMPIFEMSSLTG